MTTKPKRRTVKPKPKQTAPTAPTDGFKEPTRKGSSNGKSNLFGHGRYAQGGVFDLHVMHSALTGKPFNLKMVQDTIKSDNALPHRAGNLRNVPTNSGRFDDHIQHLQSANDRNGKPHASLLKVLENDKGEWLGVIVDDSIKAELEAYTAEFPIPIPPK